MRGDVVDDRRRTGRMSFRPLTRHVEGRSAVIVRFLALLERCKQGLIELNQAERFGEIEVEWTGDDQAAAEGLLGVVDAYDG